MTNLSEVAGICQHQSDNHSPFASFLVPLVDSLVVGDHGPTGMVSLLLTNVVDYRIHLSA